MALRLHPGVTIVPPGRLTARRAVITSRSSAPISEPGPGSSSSRAGDPPRRLSSPSGLGGVRLPALREADLGKPISRSRPGRRAGGPAADARLPARLARPATARPTTTSPAMQPPASRPTCASAASRRVSWRMRARARARRRGLPQATLLARLPSPGAGGVSRIPQPQLPLPRRPLVAIAAGPRGLGGGPHRLPDRRRRDAAAGSRGVHAQPRPPDRRLVPDQGPLHRLAARGAALLGPAGRRRDRQQLRQLAVGRGHRQRHPAEPGLQPDPPGPPLRPGR